MIEKWIRAVFPKLQSIYDASPYPVQNLLTTARGGVLARMRYQRLFWRYLRQMEDRERFSFQEMKSFQAESLTRLIRHAFENVPYYRKLRLKHKLAANDIKTVEDLAKLPVLTRDEARSQWKQLISSTVSPKNTIRVFTSGTTGAGLPVVYNETAFVENWAFKARQKQWAAIDPRQWRISLFGSKIVPTDRNHPPFWTYNWFEKQILLSIFHLSDANKSFYANFLETKPNLLLEGFPTVLNTLADFLIHDHRAIPMKAVFTDGEPLYPLIRAKLENAFMTKVYDHYGMTEWAGLIQECNHGRHHLISDYGILEILDDNHQPCAAGTEGYLVWTGLINPTMPFIRYRIGDKGMLIAHQDCPCGKPFPLVSPTITRESDYLYAPDGRILSPRAINQVLKDKTAFKACQFIQKDHRCVIIRMVPRSTLARKQSQNVKKRLTNILGNSVAIQIVDAKKPIQYDNGKIPLIISKLNGTTSKNIAGGLA